MGFRGSLPFYSPEQKTLHSITLSNSLALSYSPPHSPSLLLNLSLHFLLCLFLYLSFSVVYLSITLVLVLSDSQYLCRSHHSLSSRFPSISSTPLFSPFLALFLSCSCYLSLAVILHLSIHLAQIITPSLSFSPCLSISLSVTLITLHLSRRLCYSPSSSLHLNFPLSLPPSHSDVLSLSAE